MRLQEGLVIAQKYTLKKEIGRGGMGTVWVAEHEILGSQVAIKLLNGDASDDLARRFHREAQSTALLRSPNVVHVSDIGLEDGQLYIVMELLEGEDLRSRLHRCNRLDRETAYGIVRQITRVLRKAHSLGIVHRDLKPANLFLCPDDDVEVVKILDFGIAKCLFERTITTPGTVLGTPAFMSPEQALATDLVDHRADLWSLAVIAYRMLTGAQPFVGQRTMEILRAMMRHEFVPPSRHVPSLGPAVDEFFAHALMPSKDARFEDALTLSRHLAQALDLDPRSSGASLDWAVASEGAQPDTVRDPSMVSASASTVLSARHETTMVVTAPVARSLPPPLPVPPPLPMAAPVARSLPPPLPNADEPTLVEGRKRLMGVPHPGRAAIAQAALVSDIPSPRSAVARPAPAAVAPPGPRSTLPPSHAVTQAAPRSTPPPSPAAAPPAPVNRRGFRWVALTMLFMFVAFGVALALAVGPRPFLNRLTSGAGETSPLYSAEHSAAARQPVLIR